MNDELGHALEETLRKFEADLGLPSGFYQALLEEDDWSFVIKLHALLEAAVGHLLAEVLGRPELEDVFARLSMGGQTGKLKFAGTLSCLSPEDVRFAEELGAIRNKFAHGVRHVSMTLGQYVDTLDPNQFNNFRRAFGPGRDPFPIGKKRVPEAEFVRENPKLAIWLAGMYVLGIAYQEKRLSDARRVVAAAALNAYFSPVEPDGA